jgi:hypothetical protein
LREIYVTTAINGKNYQIITIAIWNSIAPPIVKKLKAGIELDRIFSGLFCTLCAQVFDSILALSWGLGAVGNRRFDCLFFRPCGIDGVAGPVLNMTGIAGDAGGLNRICAARVPAWRRRLAR